MRLGKVICLSGSMQSAQLRCSKQGFGGFMRLQLDKNLATLTSHEYHITGFRH